MNLPTPSTPENSKKPAELRASHEDRDRVAEALRVAAGEGRLSLEELDERLETALTARTYAELTPLLADLPAEGSGAGDAVALSAPAVPAKELVKVQRVGGNIKFEGSWVVPKRMELTAHGGSVLLDFASAGSAGQITEVKIEIHGGSLRIVVAPGYAVDASEVVIHGGTVRDRSGKDVPPDTPITHRIEVTGTVLGGNVHVVAAGGAGKLRRLFGA
jgi:hypothetical protein